MLLGVLALVKKKDNNIINKDIIKVGYQKSLEMLKACRTKYGFLASVTERDNYRRIWGRDGCITGLAALLTDDADLIEGCRCTLETLARYQGPHGEIPSNVDPDLGRISYGGMTGRVDSDLWFLICISQYWQRTGDDFFLKSMINVIEKVRFLLGAWEFNNRGFLYVPITGDWADEYIHEGYVLYDQILYFQAQREMCKIHKHIHHSADHTLIDRTVRLKHLIRNNFWFPDHDELPDHVYHEILYKKGKRAAQRFSDRYWAPFFSPSGYGYRFDMMANILVSIFGVAAKEQAEKVDAYIQQEILQDDVVLLPAFYPVITPKDEDWEDLQMTFSYTFKNLPNESHNGGLWPLVTGLYAADLAYRGKQDLARKYLIGVHRANARHVDGADWRFSEFLHGATHEPGGTPKMAWSAAAAIIAHAALNGKGIIG